MRRNFTPLASPTGLPDSVTLAASFVGTKTVAVEFGGMVTSIVSFSPSRFQLLTMRP
jgi:hypothetical protein